MRMTTHEIVLVTAILLALLTGAAVKHYREQLRAEAAASASVRDLRSSR